jgi:hypothetical protein
MKASGKIGILPVAARRLPGCAELRWKGDCRYSQVRAFGSNLLSHMQQKVVSNRYLSIKTAK